MEMEKIYSLSPEVLQKFKEMQSKYHYTRILQGESESGYYTQGSTVRFWLNDENTEYQLHWHPAIEMIIPIENDYTVIAGQETHVLHPGDIFIIPGGELHHLIAPPSGQRLIFLFDFELLSKIKGYSYLLSYFVRPTLINKENCEPIYENEAALISQLCSDYFQDDSLRDIMLYSKLLSFMVNYVRFRMQEPEHNDTFTNENKQKDFSGKFNNLIDYIEEHYAEELPLEKAADIAGFSKFHFSRLFKQCTGYYFYDYLCFRRIKAAEMLLLNPGISITEVALQSGFASLSTFNRTFRKVKCCTPSEYRGLYSAQFKR